MCVCACVCVCVCACVCHTNGARTQARMHAHTYTRTRAHTNPQEVFLETGVHPEVERAQREAAAAGDTGHVSLPDHDQHRPFVFWDLTVDNKPAGGWGSAQQQHGMGKRGGVGCGRARAPVTRQINIECFPHWCSFRPSGARRFLARGQNKAQPTCAASVCSSACDQPRRQPRLPPAAASAAAAAAGRLVIELFEDLHPTGANHLRNRCLPGATASLSGAAFHKLLRNYAAFVGKRCAFRVFVCVCVCVCVCVRESVLCVCSCLCGRGGVLRVCALRVGSDFVMSHTVVCQQAMPRIAS